MRPERTRLNRCPRSSCRKRRSRFQAIVDPYAPGRFLPGGFAGGLEVEEGFLTLTSLPGGLLAKVGKMKEQFGKVNTMHAHTLPWVDEPLVMKNLLGGRGRSQGFGGLGLEAAAESVVLPRGDGRGLPGQLRRRFRRTNEATSSWLGRLRGYRDITEGTNLDVGISFATVTTTPVSIHDAAVRRRRDVPLPAAAARDLPALPRAGPS